MSTLRALSGFSALTESHCDVIDSLGALAPTHRLRPVAVSAGRPDASRTSSARQICWVVVLMGVLLLAAIPAGAGQPALPDGVPNIFDTEVQAQFQPVGVTNLRGSPDFPAVLLKDTADVPPQAILVGLDARNEKETWSLTEDPIILIVVFNDSTTIKALYVDAGFVDNGKASGSYTELDGADPATLPDLLKAVFAATMQTYI